MLQKLKRILRKKLLGYDVSTYFFSQSGEDQILHSIFGKKFQHSEKGFYIDIGSYHPYHHSNTFMFYLNGWNGINIDARPGSKMLFDNKRPKDINLEMGVGPHQNTLKYYLIDENSTMNSFSKENLERIGMLKHVKKEILIDVYPLRVILAQHLPKNVNRIDFLSIDVEGFELEVLKSNDWKKYRPIAVCVELSIKRIDELGENEVHQYLESLEYDSVGKTIVADHTSTIIYLDKNYQI